MMHSDHPVMTNHSDEPSWWVIMIHQHESWCLAVMNHDASSRWITAMRHRAESDYPSWWVTVTHHDESWWSLCIIMVSRIDSSWCIPGESWWLIIVKHFAALKGFPSDNSPGHLFFHGRLFAMASFKHFCYGSHGSVPCRHLQHGKMKQPSDDTQNG